MNNPLQPIKVIQDQALRTATLQEVFDYVTTFLLRQGGKSTSYDARFSANSCSYKGPNGLRCAVGCTVSDQCYDANRETQVENVPANEFYESVNLMAPKSTLDLLEELQRIHDNSLIENWEAEFVEMTKSGQFDGLVFNPDRADSALFIPYEAIATT